MDWDLYALAIVAGYLLGNFSSGTVVSRIFGLDDIRRHGSGNPGTTIDERHDGSRFPRNALRPS